MLKNRLLIFVSIITFLAVSCMPREEKAQFLLREGSDLVAQASYDEAIKKFSKAIELMPDFAKAYSFRGSAKFDKGDLNGAFDDYSKAIEIDPTYAEPYDYRGRIRMVWSDIEGACDDFRKAFVLGQPGMYERIRRCD